MTIRLLMPLFVIEPHGTHSQRSGFNIDIHRPCASFQSAHSPLSPMHGTIEFAKSHSFPGQDTTNLDGLVTIIIPSYNYSRYLPEAIESCLKQTHPTVEVLVIDDGSTDDTPEIAARYGDRIRYIRQPNAGLSAARNRGLAEAKGSLVVLLDADDFIDPNMIEVSLAAMKRLSPPPVVIAHRSRRVDQDSHPMPHANPLPERDCDVTVLDLLIMNRFTPTLLADRRALIDCGGFDTSFRASEDRDMWVRLATHYRVHRLKTVLSSKRCHTSNMSGNWKRQAQGIRKVFHKAYEAKSLPGWSRIWWLKIWSFYYFQLGMMQGRTVPARAILSLIISFLLWPVFLDQKSFDQKTLFRLRMMIWVLRGAKS